MHLLSHESSNAKLAKNAAYVTGYETYILYLAPATTVAGLNLCPAASPGCLKACLFTAGRGAMSSVAQARIRKTEMYRDDRAGFMFMLFADLRAAAARAKRLGVRVAVRLNGTSDIAWETETVAGHANVMAAFPEITFYDYTKRPERAAASLRANWPANYSLTFSRSEANDSISQRLANRGANVAVVFDSELPAQYFGRAVIDGTTHDMRFLDTKGVVVGLLAKGRARRDDSGFVVAKKAS
jgi:hypothetical protein